MPQIGDSYVGGEWKWLHCQWMDERMIAEIIQNTAKLIPNLGDLMEEQWHNALTNGLDGVDPLSEDYFNKMIKLYTREGGQFYLMLNWNLRANEWYNVQRILSLVIFALKCVCEGYCFDKFKTPKFAPYDGTVHRVMNYRKSIAKQIQSLKPGDQIYFGGFTSTTKNIEMIPKIAVGRAVEFEPRRRGIYLNIEVHGEHKCAVDISTKSAVGWEEEVLISCFTRFEILAISVEEKCASVYLRSLPPEYKTWSQWESERALRDKLASLAYSYKFDECITLIKDNKSEYPMLTNSTRPDSSKFWTVGHQILHSPIKNKDEYLEQLRDLGFWDGARDHLGRLISDISRARKDNWKCTNCHKSNDIGQKLCSKCGKEKKESSGCVLM